MNLHMTPENASAPNPGSPRAGFVIKVLGVGGAGGNAVSHLAQQDLSGMHFAALNTDAAALAKSAVPTKLVLGAKAARGLGAGGDPARGRAAAVEAEAEIRALCQGADVVFLIAGLGGGTGTGASPLVAAIAKECGALVLSIVILPFECEGGRRMRQAQLGLEELKSAADGVICVPNQKVFKLIDEKTSLLEAFHITNDFVARGVRGIWRLLSRPGLINVDFADLCAVTQGRHAESALATAEARGENRVREVMEKLLSHPLMEGGQALVDAGGVLVCIAAGPDLTMADVNRVMEQVNRQCEQAHIIMGAAIDEELADRLSVTLLASKGGAQPEPAATISAPSAARGMAPAPSGAARPTSFDIQLANPEVAQGKGTSRFVPPPPALTPEKTEQLIAQQGGPGRARKGTSRLRQGQLPLEIISKGRFEKSEPTIHQGQDLDVPTYIRRGVALN
jgi:cell division protein FtsZ